MLLEFAVENYLSIKEEQILSMLASKADKSLPDNLLEFGNQKSKILNAAVIYGANASGKSNLLHALKKMKSLVVDSSKINEGDSIPVVPFIFDALYNQKPSKFEICCVIEEIKYIYGFYVNEEKVYEEYLYYYPNGRKSLIFDRHENQYKFTIDKEEQLALSKRTLPNRFYLAEATNWNYAETRPMYKWFKEKLIVNISSNVEAFAGNRVKNDKIFGSFTKRLLAQADIGISNIEVQKKTLTNEDLPEDMPEMLKTFLSGKNAISIEFGHLVEGEVYSLSLANESDGTQRIFGLSPYFYDAMLNGGILVIDELENSLHPIIVRFLVSLFADKTQNQNGAQLIFSTHNTSLLDLDLFRRDQIWFTEKHPEQLSTELYSLFDIKARKDENPARGYLMGRYGAIPIVGSGILFPIDG